MLAIIRLIAFLTLVLDAVAGGVARSTKRSTGWTRRFLAPRDAPIRLTIALKLDNDGSYLANQLLLRANPNAAMYREWLTPAQASSLVLPDGWSIRRVQHWLKVNGLAKQSSSYGGFFNVDTTVRNAERLLNTTYWVYSDGHQDIVRTELYHLPDHITDEIEFVAPTTEFPRASARNTDIRTLIANSKQRQRRLRRRAASCGASDYTTPTCVRQIYDINYTATPNRTTFAVYATESAKYSASDLHTYLSYYNPPAAQASANFQVNGNGDPSEGAGGIEAAFETSLDTQTSLGLAWPAQGILYNRGGVFGPNPGQIYDPFVDFLQQLIQNKTVPSVVSFSESMPEDQVDAAYAKRLCSMMAQVGARGVTLVFSSGDNGPNGDQPSGTHKQIFEPEFPASCPWVLSVGGTTNLAAETAATKSTIPTFDRISYTASGGGFSNLFPIPDYQKPKIQPYINTHIPSSYHTASGFNPNGRGIPDVSAFSTDFPTVTMGLTVGIGGTSASTPLWAAIITLLNDYEASKGRPPLGFVNPLLYQLTSGLKDITTGGNSAGSCNPLTGCHLAETLGYNVTVGWDPVTGLGSPIFSALTQALDARAKDSGNGSGKGEDARKACEDPATLLADGSCARVVPPPATATRRAV